MGARLFTLNNLLQAAAAGLTLLGYFLVGNKTALGFAVGIAGELLWLAYAVRRRIVFLGLLAIVFTVMHARNLWVWS